MKVSLKKAFSILDGRLSTEIGDVYEMLNYIFDTSLMTHQLPKAMDILIKTNPKWFKESVQSLNDIKRNNNTDNFEQLMKLIDKRFSLRKIKLKKSCQI
jgi:hypothetical protein